MRGRTLMPTPTNCCSKLCVVPVVPKPEVLPVMSDTSWPATNFASLLSRVNTRGCCRMRTELSVESACRKNPRLSLVCTSRRLVSNHGAAKFCEPAGWPAPLPLVSASERLPPTPLSPPLMGAVRPVPTRAPHEKPSPTFTSASTAVIITWRPGLSSSWMISMTFFSTSGGAITSTEFCSELGTTRLRPMSPLTSLGVPPPAAPWPAREPCHGKRN